MLEVLIGASVVFGLYGLFLFWFFKVYGGFK